MSLKNTLSETLTSSLNRYRLDIPSCTSPLDVEEFSGRECMSALYLYTIRFTSVDHDISAEQLLNKSATLSMGTGSLAAMTGMKVIHGTVTHFRRISGSADQSTYQILVEPFFALLGRQFRTHRFFVNKSVPEVVEQVLQEHGLHGWEYEFNLKQGYPKREQINQYQESDLTFIQRLLAEVGIFYWFTLQEDTQSEVVHFADAQRALMFGKTLPVNSPSGMSDSGTDSVWGLNVSHNVVEANVTTKDYNHRDAQSVLQSAPADMTRGDGEGITYGEVYHYRLRHLERGDKIDPQAETANFYARLDHERFLADQTLITAASTDSTLSPAQVLTITDSLPPTLPETLQAPVLIVSTHFTASRKDALRVDIIAVPYSETLCWRPPLLPRPKVTGTMTARVTSAKANDIYAWQDASGLYRVKFDADRDDKSQGQESMPVRLAKPYGGDVYGFHFPLIQGTEVAIAFHEGDPDRPYIAHALHDSRHVDHVTEKNSTRNVIRTPANNKLRMEDKRGAEHIKLSTEYGGKTQLNLGHNVDAGRKLRGEGFELRTDSWGALRGGKGLFITADAQSLASGKMLEMQDTLDRLKQAGDEMDSLSRDAQSAKADPAQIDQQLAFMREQIDQLKEAVAVLSAPKGVAISSGKHLQLTANRNLIVNAGADADMGVMKRLFIGVGEGLSLFVRKLGMKIISNQGPVTIQAQNDQLQLLARKDLEIVSTDDEIHIIAKKKIIINAGGSYLTLDPCRIEFGTNGDFEVKAADFMYSGPASMKADHPDYPPLQSNVRQSLNLKIMQSPNAQGISWAGMPYTLYADGAPLKNGVLDERGQIPIDHQVVTQNYKLEMANGVTYQIPVVEAYSNPEQGKLANRGFHHHASQADAEISSPSSHTEHRNIYADLLDGRIDKEECQ
ncbi:type VI secretion system tip protein VgrG [Enterobacter cancerogenus]|uniref:Type VI secretion system tip protein VgrG n=1 Tax=Enterobacter cancerogenus TaxID=69218 RepID=A0AB38NY82_9ENTR|nr:type VI secretion system tip protein VgrG [Enterobacter cancerogenus]TKK13760.1 type VI secretion system tip protein VgrG [Enterobacter cancerogenus]